MKNGLMHNRTIAPWKNLPSIAFVVVSSRSARVLFMSRMYWLCHVSFFLVLLHVSSNASTHDQFLQKIRQLEEDKEYAAIVHEMRQYLSALPETWEEPGQEDPALWPLNSTLTSIIRELDTTDALYDDYREIIKSLCIRIFKRGLKSPFDVRRLPRALYEIQILIGLGFTDEACGLLENVARYVPDDITVDNYLLHYVDENPGWSGGSTRQDGMDILGILLVSILPLFCDETLEYEERNERIVSLIAPYREQPWIPQVLAELSRSWMWGKNRTLYPSKQTEGYYSFLSAVEPFIRDHPKVMIWTDKFYNNLLEAADALGRYEDLVKWCNILVARAETSSDAFFARSKLSSAVRKLREHQSAPHPHEDDIKMMEELGLLFE